MVSLQIPAGNSPQMVGSTSTEEKGGSSALERTKSLNEMPKLSPPELLKELYDKSKEVQSLTAQRDELRVKVSQLLDQLRPLRLAAQTSVDKDRTIEQLQEAILASKYEVAGLRHQLGLYESASRDICTVLEKGHLSNEDRVRVLNCIRSAERDSRDLQSSRSNPVLVTDDTGEFEELFTRVQRRETKSKGKLSGLRSPYRAPPASMSLLSRQYKGNTSVRRAKSPKSSLQTVRSPSPPSKPLDQQCQDLVGRLKATLEGWTAAYLKKQVR